MHQVGFRGAAKPEVPAANTSGDATLDLAVEVVQQQPVAQL
jgi:hypothetical protein